jgi:glycosyltransferase involved in cell wall biosynthesis
VVSGGRRLLVVSNFFDTHRGGLEIVAGRLAGELAARGFEVTWLATDATAPAKYAADKPIRTVSVGAANFAETLFGIPFPLLTPGAILRLWREVKAADAVLLHDSLYMTSMVAFLASRRWAKPLVIIQHIGVVPYRHFAPRLLMALANRRVAGPLLSGAERVVFISQFVRDHFSATRLKRPAELIFNGVDGDVFRPAESEEKARARARLGLAADRPVALFVGRFVEKKGLHLLRLAAARRPGVTWALAGWGVIDPRAWGAPNVHVFGGLSGPALADLYRAGDVLVLPSQGEGFPLVIQEALACGLPVVCGAQTATADPAVADFLTGVDVAGADTAGVADHLAAAVDRVLADTTPGEAGRRSSLARRRYAWPAAADRYAQILEGVIGPRPAVADAARAA